MRVGIDFGTTTSTVSRLTPGGSLDTQGPIPSLGAWKNGQFFYEKEAEELLFSDDVKAYPVRDLKLSLGRKDLRVGPLQLSTEAAATELFRYLGNRIAKGEIIEEAVIGTPVHVTLEHRLALGRAAAAAGFKSTRLVYEPTSALIGAVDIETLDARSLVLVVDWGGGTLDVAIVRKEGQVLQEIAVDGDVSTLGGSKMDDELVRVVLKARPELTRKVDAIDGGFERLKHEIEGAKIEILESGFEDEADEARHVVPRWLREDIEIKPSDVFSVIRKLAEKARDQIVKFINQARIAPSDITHILFAGGVCNSPIVQEMISSEFRSARKIDTLKPQLLTGIGCAKLMKKGFSIQLSSAFGIRQCDDSFCSILHAGHDLSIGEFRTADFMLTDVLAAEAVFDFGICRDNGGAVEMFSSPSDGFRSLGQLFIRAQEYERQYKGSVPDVVRVYCGVGASLAVSVYAESQLTGYSETKALTGMPFCIRLGS